MFFCYLFFAYSRSITVCYEAYFLLFQPEASVQLYIYIFFKKSLIFSIKTPISVLAFSSFITTMKRAKINSFWLLTPCENNSFHCSHPPVYFSPHPSCVIDPDLPQVHCGPDGPGQDLLEPGELPHGGKDFPQVSGGLHR